MGVARRFLFGAGAGLGGTLAMSLVMLAAKRVGLMGALPPKRITAGVLDALGLRRSRGAENLVAAGAHLGYGMAAGAVFGLFRNRMPVVPSWARGAVFGALIWAASYFGWVPALGLMPPPSRDRPGRPSSMLLSHLVYGAVLQRLQPSSLKETRT